MLDKIRNNPFLSLGIIALVLAGVVLDSTKTLNPIVVFMGLYGVFLLFLNFVRTDGKLDYDKVDRKEVRSHLEMIKEEEDELNDPKRREIFLGLGKTVLNGETLREMSYSEDAYTKAFVALHPSTPADILTELSYDLSDQGMLSALVANPHTPKAIAHKIQYSVLEKIDDEETQIEILNDPTSNEIVLKQIFLNPFDDKIVNALLIKHPNISEELFEELTDGNSIEVLIEVASSSKVINNPKLIAKLKNWLSYDIALTLLTNPSINGRTLDLYDIFNQDRNSITEIIKERKTLDLPTATLAWIGRSAAIYKGIMAEMIKEKSPEYASMPNDDIIKNF